MIIYSEIYFNIKNNLPLNRQPFQETLVLTVYLNNLKTKKKKKKQKKGKKKKKNKTKNEKTRNQ